MFGVESVSIGSHYVSLGALGGIVVCIPAFALIFVPALSVCKKISVCLFCVPRKGLTLVPGRLDRIDRR